MPSRGGVYNVVSCVDHVVIDVVVSHICCCYACGECGDLLSLRKSMVVCSVWAAVWMIMVVVMF